MARFLPGSGEDILLAEPPTEICAPHGKEPACQMIGVAAEHAVLAASHIDDDVSDGHIVQENRRSVFDDEIPDIIKIEYRFPSGEEACRPMSIPLDFGLSCGHFWRHLCDCGVDMEKNKLAVDTQVVDVHMNVVLLASVKKQLQATPGVLRITVVHTTA